MVDNVGVHWFFDKQQYCFLALNMSVIGNGCCSQSAIYNGIIRPIVFISTGLQHGQKQMDKSRKSLPVPGSFA